MKVYEILENLQKNNKDECIIYRYKDFEYLLKKDKNNVWNIYDMKNDFKRIFLSDKELERFLNLYSDCEYENDTWQVL